MKLPNKFSLGDILEIIKNCWMVLLYCQETMWIVDKNFGQIKKLTLALAVKLDALNTTTTTTFSSINYKYN